MATWYDGSRGPPGQSGEEIPLGARMIAIVEAFDAMTTDRVYRPAMSQERAMAELFRCAGTQFDPILVRQFVEMLEGDRRQLRKDVAARWLLTLDPADGQCLLGLHRRPAACRRRSAAQRSALFEAKLLDNMYDAVVFVDAAGRIVAWNHGAERLTGIAGRERPPAAVAPGRAQAWPTKRASAIAEAECPVLTAIRRGVQSLRRLTIGGRERAERGRR